MIRDRTRLWLCGGKVPVLIEESMGLRALERLNSRRIILIIVKDEAEVRPGSWSKSSSQDQKAKTEP